MHTTESTHRRQHRGGIEVDTLSREGQRAYAWHAGERHAVKTRYARRVRRSTRQALVSSGNSW